MAIHVELATELEAGAARKILSVEIFCYKRRNSTQNTLTQTFIDFLRVNRLLVTLTYP